MKIFLDWMWVIIVWEVVEFYFYFRIDVLGWIIVGGEDEDVVSINLDFVKLVWKVKVIVEKLCDVMGVDIGKLVYIWLVLFSVIKDGLLIIDMVFGYSCIYMIMGFGGNGIIFLVIGI